MIMLSRNLPKTSAVAVTGSSAGLPELPPGVVPYRAAFKNWSGEIVVESLWTCSASTPEDVVLQYQNQ